MALDVYKEWLGIPEGDRPPDHYDLLRLKRFEDDAEKIRKHYLKLNAHVRKYASGQYATESQNLLNELAKAMLCLTDTERKREYDESLGREFDQPAAAATGKTLEKVLVDQGKISAAQAKEAAGFAEARGLSMRDAVVQMKFVDADTATEALAVELGRSFIDLNQMLPDDSVLDRVPRNVVKRNVILPLFVDGDCLLVACAHEPDPELEDEMRLRFDMPMRAVMATPLAVNQAIAKYYAPGMRDESAAQQTAASPAKKSKKKGKSGEAAPEKSRPRKAPPARKPFDELTPEEKRERKQLGYIILCWGFAGPVLIDEFLMKPYVLPEALSFGYIPSITTFIVAPVVFWWVFKVYWK